MTEFNAPLTAEFHEEAAHRLLTRSFHDVYGHNGVAPDGTEHDPVGACLTELEVAKAQAHATLALSLRERDAQHGCILECGS